ncbi:MAG: 50S ribosomal protein L13 [Elusimicrobiota bacterium]
MRTTYQANSKAVIRKWHLIDASNQVLGRLATVVANKLSGKSKSLYTPHVDCGDHVVIINAQGIRITGNNKPVQKIDFRHSGYPGGDTMTPYKELLEKKPERAITLAVSGMLAKTRLRKDQIARLKVYRGGTHPHGAQFAQPKAPVAAAQN